MVLVHGAWADGSSWNKVTAELQRRGFEVVAAQLPLTSLSDDVTALRRVLHSQDAPVVLAGHSYGGAVITAARPPAILR
jgi:pimeloyl-ACP methyl ester carboxylesterase